MNSAFSRDAQNWPTRKWPALRGLEIIRRNLNEVLHGGRAGGELKELSYMEDWNKWSHHSDG